MHTASAKCPAQVSLESLSNASKMGICVLMDVTLGLPTVQGQDLDLFGYLRSGLQMSMDLSGPKSILSQMLAMLSGFGRIVCRFHNHWKPVGMFCHSGGTVRTLHRCGTLAQILKSSENVRGPNKEIIAHARSKAIFFSQTRLQCLSLLLIVPCLIPRSRDKKCFEECHDANKDLPLYGDTKTEISFLEVPCRSRSSDVIAISHLTLTGFRVTDDKLTS